MILLLDSRFYLDMSSVQNVHLLSVWFVVSCVGSLVVCSWAMVFNATFNNIYSCMHSEYILKVYILVRSIF